MFTATPSPSWIRCPNAACNAKLGEWIEGRACSEAHLRGREKRILRDVGEIVCEKCQSTWQNPRRGRRQ